MGFPGSSGSSAGGRARPGDADRVEMLLGRPPRGAFDVVVRGGDGDPAVIRNAPFLADGTPMPTRYWLVDPVLRLRIDRLEAAGGVRAAEAEVAPAAVAAAHARYAAERDAAVPPSWRGPRPSGGVAGTRRGVKCLHAHYAWFLAGGDDPVGRWTDDALRRMLAAGSGTGIQFERGSTMIDADDFMALVDRALDGMAAIVTGLGDDLANSRPDLTGANSPYAILTHCLGVTRWWGLHVVAGRDVERDKEAEWVASGPVAALVARIPEVRAGLAAVVAETRPGDPIRGGVAANYVGTRIGTTAGAALLHLYEELAQHHGQMEVVRDALVPGT